MLLLYLCVLADSVCSQTRILVSGSYDVSDCSFSGFTTTNAGGTIYYDTGSYIGVIRCDFSLCISGKQGGAVYVGNTEFLELRQLCGHLCHSATGGFSGQFILKNNGINGVSKDIAASKCWNTTSFGDDSLCLCRSKNETVSHCNFSQNYGYNHETAAFHAFTNNNVTFSYSNVINNVGSRAFGVYLESGSSHSVHHLNIIGNTVSSSLIYIKTPIQLEHCYIHSNSLSVGPSITLLHSVDSSHSILINHCSFHIESTKQQQIMNHTHLFVFMNLLFFCYLH